MKINIHRRFSILIALAIILAFAFAVPAQKRTIASVPSFAEDTAINPHDFNDDYYMENGVNPKMMFARRSGTDFASVFSYSSNPIHREVRVLATLPAFDAMGAFNFWYPLAEIGDNGFMDDYTGLDARAIADAHLLYVFPMMGNTNPLALTGSRQAAMFDDTNAYIYEKGNPLGLRRVIVVNYTEKAFATKEGILMMLSMIKKNGRALDGTPILKERYDLDYLLKEGFIAMTKTGFRDDTPDGGMYVIAPAIDTAIKGVIAPDAFLLTVHEDGKPLVGEEIFARQFECLQKTGELCTVK